MKRIPGPLKRLTSLFFFLLSLHPMAQPVSWLHRGTGGCGNIFYLSINTTSHNAAGVVGFKIGNNINFFRCTGSTKSTSPIEYYSNYKIIPSFVYFRLKNSANNGNISCSNIVIIKETNNFYARQAVTPAKQTIKPIS